MVIHIPEVSYQYLSHGYVNLFWKQGCVVWKGSWRPKYKDIESPLSASQQTTQNLEQDYMTLETQGTICP